jgi:hypothetical protein
MRKDLLLRLADLLEADASNDLGIKFDLSEWGLVRNKEEPVSCGTTACAMGLAALSGAFKDEGLSYRFYDDEGACRFVEVFVGDESGFRAASKLFDIPTYVSEFLFAPNLISQSKISGAIGERFVAKRIRDFIAGKFPELEERFLEGDGET